MLQKIRYRLCYNYANRLNRDGRAPIALECRQENKKMYLSSRVLVSPGQWHKGMIVNHDNAEKLTAFLVRWRNEVEEIELDMLLKGKRITLYQLKTAVRSGTRPNATIREFTESVIIPDSRRCENTKKSYLYLVNDIEAGYGNLRVTDMNYDFIVRYREAMRKKGLSENTVKGRLKALRCICEQARLRDLIDSNPFDNITIGNMTPRVEYLDMKDVRRLERLELEGKEEKVRDMFLFSVYTGLRFSDLASLEEADMKDGILRKRMKKTHHYVSIPIATLFWGKGMEIWNKYPDIRELSHCVCNTTFNRMIKEIGAKAGVRKNLHCHLGRKTCSNLLSSMGLSVDDVSTILGHRDKSVTRKHYLFNDEERVLKTVRKLFRT